MSLSFQLTKHSTRANIVLGVMLLMVTPIALAQTSQTSWATLDAPPTGIAPAGDVLRPGHLGRQISNVEEYIHFYHDLLGLELRGPREEPRRFGQNRGLQEVASLVQGVPDPYQQASRVVLLPIPGTAAAPSGPEMHFHRPHFQDPGAAHFLFMSKDDDVMIDHVKAAKLHTTGPSDAPVFIAPTTRMFFVTDPQGFWLEFMDNGVKKDPAAK